MKHIGWVKRVCHRWMMKRISRKLELDNVQREKLYELQMMMEGMGNTFCGVQQHSHEKLRELVTDEKFNRDKAGDLLQMQLERVKEAGRDAIEQFGEFIDSLQPAQRQKLREHLQQRCFA